ncbi:MAG: S9 family peptidase, partial [Candidatus Baltobacteraceae bacterium]
MSLTDYEGGRFVARTDGVVDILHGTPVADPYRSLEDTSDAGTVAWQATQNARTRAALDALSGRSALAERFEGLLRMGSVSPPVVRGGRAFYEARRRDENQAALRVLSGSEDRVLVDPAALDERGLIALDWWYPNRDGSLVAYGVSENG